MECSYHVVYPTAGTGHPACTCWESDILPCGCEVVFVDLMNRHRHDCQWGTGPVREGE